MPVTTLAQRIAARWRYRRGLAQGAPTQRDPWVVRRAGPIAVCGLSLTVLAMLFAVTSLPRWYADDRVPQPTTSSVLEEIAWQKAHASIEHEGRDLAVRLAAGIGAVTLGLLAWAGIELTRRDQRLREEQLHGDRTRAAIADLSADALDLRIAAIAQLEQRARTTPSEAPVVVDVLGAFVRSRTSARTPGEPLPVEVSAALAALGRTRPAPDLSGSDLREAQLAGLNLTGANLTGANLTGASLVGTTLRRANLIGATLRRSNLRRVNLSGANLTEASLWQADVNDADLRGVIFSSADLRECDLTGADVSGAHLRTATLTGVDLSDVRHDTATTWPDGLMPEPSPAPTASVSADAAPVGSDQGAATDLAATLDPHATTDLAIATFDQPTAVEDAAPVAEPLPVPDRPEIEPEPTWADTALGVDWPTTSASPAPAPAPTLPPPTPLLPPPASLALAPAIVRYGDTEIVTEASLPPIGTITWHDEVG